MKEFEFLKAELDKMKENKTWQQMKQIETKQGPSVEVKGKNVIQLSSNNYLGLTSHPRLVEAAKRAAEEFGAGTGSVRTIAGTFTMHNELEKNWQTLKTEAALVFQSGFTTNQGVLSSILTKEDIVISDELNHASIIDGIRLTKADKRCTAMLIWTIWKGC